MNEGRHVKLFTTGRNQAVRIPREFEFDGDEAVMRKDGDRLILEPIRMAPSYFQLRQKGLSTQLFQGWFGPRGLATILFVLLILENTHIPHRHELLTITVALNILCAISRIVVSPLRSATSEL